MRHDEAVPGAHSIRNYLIFAILTIGVIAAAGVLVSRQITSEKRGGSTFGVVAKSCSLSGRLVALPEVSEASGLALSSRSPGLLWTHEDSRPVLFAIDVLGNVKGRVAVTEAPVQDFEDLAIGSCGAGGAGKACLYIGDIGDNHGRRERITVYRVPEPLPSESVTAPAEAFHATYPDGPKDAEALFVSEGGLHIVTKGNNGPIALYRFPELRSGASVRLEHVATLHEASVVRSDRVTGANTSADGHWVVLRTFDAVLFYEARALLRGSPSRPHRYDVSWLQESQSEGVAIGKEGALYLVSEGGARNAPGKLAHGVCKLPAGRL